LARSAKDLKLMLEVMTTPEQLPLPPPRAAALQDFRVALWLTDPALETDQEVVDALQAVVDGLMQAGVSVVETHPDLDLTEHAEAHRQLRFAITRGLGLPPEELRGLLDERERLQGLWEAFFDDFDVLLAPTAQTAAIEHDLSPILSRTIVVNGEEQPYQSLDVWRGPAGFAGLPATTAPMGRTVSGLPLGVQIVGPYMGDLTTIGFAERLAERTGGFEAPPGY
jgi:amidase